MALVALPGQRLPLCLTHTTLKPLPPCFSGPCPPFPIGESTKGHMFLAPGALLGPPAKLTFW